MPLSATLEDIKAYQDLLEKQKIRPDSLPPCPRCNVHSAFFRAHCFRERLFLLLIEMIVTAVHTALVRFKCTGCGKTFTYYPAFALPFKRYTTQTILGYSQCYVDNERHTYQKTVMTGGSAPGYPEDSRTMAPSTIHRWISGLSHLNKTPQVALSMCAQEDPSSSISRDLSCLSIAEHKFRSQPRKEALLRCRALVLIQALFKTLFKTSIFTELARACSYG